MSINPPFEDNKKPTHFYYPGTLNLDQAERIEVGIDQAINKNIRLPPGIKIKVENSSEPLKIVLPLPKPAPSNQ